MSIDVLTRSASAPATEPPPRAVDGGSPVFIAGPDRSGTTLLYALLASHPEISMARRTNMWRYFHRRYGDLEDDANLERCLGDMVRYRRMRHLDPDVERIRREFRAGPRTYGRLFALFHQHQAERFGKPRWGDKSLHTEHYAARVFHEFPTARIVHMVRDPRDRYASVRKRYGRDRNRVGAATGRWLTSTRAGLRNARRYPDRYMLVRYEDLARRPEVTMREVCAFVDVEMSPRMFTMAGAPEHRDRGGNSSFGDLEPGTISTKAIGRFRDVLTPSETAFIQLVARRELRALGYHRAPVAFSPAQRARHVVVELPVHLLRLAAAEALAAHQRRRGEPLPPRHLG
jgi:hypothetical protein